MTVESSAEIQCGSTAERCGVMDPSGCLTSEAAAESNVDPRVSELQKGQRPGDILLFHRPRGITPRLISLFTRSPYYHVAIAADDLHTIEARPKGIVRRDLREPEGGHCFEVIRMPHGVGGQALEWAETQIG